MERVPGENDGLWRRDLRPKAFDRRSTEERLRVVSGETWVETPKTRKLWELIHNGLREPPQGAQGAFVVGGASAGTSGFAEAVVAAASEANADAGTPNGVTWLALLGSVLDAGDDALVGDVDLIVRIQRRRLLKDELTRLKEA